MLILAVKQRDQRTGGVQAQGGDLGQGREGAVFGGAQVRRGDEVGDIVADGIGEEGGLVAEAEGSALDNVGAGREHGGIRT